MKSPHRTADGHICILPYTDRHWRDFFRLAGRPELAEDPRLTDAQTRSRHVAELYAPFSNTEFHSIEAAGLADLGQSVAQLRSGRFSLGGEIPVNPSGGTLCTNAIAVTAMIRAAEIALQVCGRAGASAPRRRPPARAACAPRTRPEPRPRAVRRT